MHRVFLPYRSSRFNITDAERFGEIIFLTKPREFSPFNTTLTVEALHAALEEAEFNPDEDFVCLTGEVLITAIFLAVASERYGRVKLLMFDAKVGRYAERMIDVTQEGVVR